MSERGVEDPELEELVASALEARGRGEDVDLDTLCRTRPDLREAVAASLETASRMPIVQARGASRDPFAGRVLADRYELRRRLGAGAMGVVYEAYDTELQRPVAVKVLRTLLMEGSEAEARFLREAETLAAVRHPGVVTVYDRGRTDDQDPFLVMELLEGATLSELLDCFEESTEGPGRVELAAIAARLGASAIDDSTYLRLVVRWTAAVAAGLEAAHAAGIFHRDVKPSNIFVRSEGPPVLLDFGIAADTDRATLTREGATLGTPAYMAPEALAGDSKPRATLDVYGLAATLYHLLTLRSPYSGSPSQILTALAVKEPVRAEKLRPGLPRDHQAILDRGMARRPVDRYPTAQAFARDLHAFLEHRPVEARRLSPFARAVRRVRASRGVRGGLLVVALGAIAMTTVSWRSHVRDVHARAYRAAWRQVPGNFTLGDPAHRRFQPRHAEVLRAILDDAVEHAAEPIPANVTRAAFRLDHGDPVGAAADMRVVAASVGTDYARSLAAAYAALPPDATTATEVDLTGLPEPVSGLDRYLAAFHARRADRRADVRELLAHDELQDHVPSLALQLAYLVRERSPRTLDVIERIESAFEGRTAATAHWTGTYHFVATRDYARAAEVLTSGVELNDVAHGLHVYGGWSLMKLGEYEEAVELFLRAQAIRPESPGGYELQARALIEMGEYDAAREVVEGAPYGSGETADGKRAKHLGEVEAERALASYRAGDAEAARRVARVAVAEFEEAERLGQDVALPRRAIALALATGDHAPVFASLLELGRRREALTPEYFAVLEGWIPETLGPVETQELRSLIERLAR